jgi:hypothetical protein
MVLKFLQDKCWIWNGLLPKSLKDVHTIVPEMIGSNIELLFDGIECKRMQRDQIISLTLKAEICGNGNTGLGRLTNTIRRLKLFK